MFKRLRKWLDDQVSQSDVIAAGEAATKLGTEQAYSTFLRVYTFFRSFNDVARYDTGPDNFQIICPDCGKGLVFRGGCPKCGGKSWIPAGHKGGIPENIRARCQAESFKQVYGEENVIKVDFDAIERRVIDEMTGNAGALV